MAIGHSDQNVERLLSTAYQPEAPDPDFVQRVEKCLLETARQLAEARETTLSLEDKRLQRLRRRLSWIMGTAAAVAGVALVWHAATYKPGATPIALRPKFVEPDPYAIGAGGLTPRSRPAAAPAKPIAIGATVRTGAGERRRVTLPDGSVLYVNERSTFTLDGSRQVTLAAGEVFAEVAPQAQTAGTPFVIKTPSRAVSALGTRFTVRADSAGTGVVVTQGKVKVSGLDGLLLAGQQLSPGAAALAPAPRASHVLGWTRDLMAQAESPLVPGSKFAGGAIVAVDPNGQETRLSLRKYHVDVHIEDGFARTTIDQTFFNEMTWRLEGTFYFPLPPDASLSRLAMYVDGRLMEGGMAERDHARNVYEQILYTRRDPALLEWVDGGTFKMRVFPLEGRQEKRIILSYTQRLPSLYGRMQYRFPAGHSLEMVRDWSFHARVKGGTKLSWHSDSHTLKETWSGSDVLLDSQARNIRVERDVALDLYENGSVIQDQESARFSSAEHEGQRYLMVRYRPDLPTKLARERRDWIFLFESSAERDPLVARAQVEIIRHLLANAEHDDTFALLTAGTRAHAYSDKPQPATSENIHSALEQLEYTHLIGALDLGRALDACVPIVKVGKNPYLVHVGSGLAALGERQEDKLIKHLPEGAHYVGIGVGKRWSRSFMKSAAERTGGYFTQINPDEPIEWRAFELAATLNTPRLLDVKVVDNAERVTFLSYVSSIAQGEEICAITRMGPDVNTLPNSITITGSLDGKPFRRVVSVHAVADHADYLPRTWAKLEIDLLLAENAQGNKEKITALSKAMYVMTPFTSLLVLETEEMYKQFNVDRGRKDHWAMYPCPERIPVVSESLPNQPPSVRGATQAKEKQKKLTAEEVLQTILVRVPARILCGPGEQPHYSAYQTLTAWQLYTGACAFGNLTHDQTGELDLAAEFVFDTFRTVNSSMPTVAFSPNGLNLAGGAFRDSRIRIWDAATGKEIDQSGWLRHRWLDNRGIRRIQLKDVLDDTAMTVGYTTIDDAEIPLARVSDHSPAFSVRLLDNARFFSTLDGDERIPQWYLKGLGYYPPARALVVKGTSRIHTGMGRFGFGGGMGFLPRREEEVEDDRPFIVTGIIELDRPGSANNLTQIQELNRVRQDRFLSTAIPEAAGRANRMPSRLELKFRGRFDPENPADPLGTEEDLMQNVWAYLRVRHGSPIPVLPPSIWHAITALRNEKRESSGFTEGNPDTLQRIWEMKVKLNKPVSLDKGMDKIPLKDALEFLSDRYDITILVDVNAFKLDGVQDDVESVQVRLPKMVGVSLRTVLRLLSGQVGGTFLIRRDYIEITTRQRAVAEKIVWANPVSDLVIPIADYFESNSIQACADYADLVAYAPGMYTSRADMLAALEVEADKAALLKPGLVDPAARAMITKARRSTWQTLVLPGQREHAPSDFTFDGTGRFVHERTLAEGLLERVVCNGKTLLHLYPELGIGARRSVSRFLRDQFAAALPWVLPPAEDLAHGADLKCIGDRVVAILPHVNAPSKNKDKPASYYGVHLVFAESGRLSERRLVEMPSGKMLFRETYADGEVKLFDAGGKELGSHKYTIRPAKAPVLNPDLTNLVVLPLPWRTPEHVQQLHKLDLARGYRDLEAQPALELLATYIGSQDGVKAMELWRQRFKDRGDKRLGFSTLLASCGMLVEPESPDPLARYLRFVSDEKKRNHAEIGNLGPGAGGLVQRLAEFHDLGVRLSQSGEPATGNSVQPKDREQAFAFIRQNRSSYLGWALLSQVKDRDESPEYQRAVADLYSLFVNVPGLSYTAKYERGRSLLKNGQRQLAEEEFVDLYSRTFAAGILPPLDATFYTALGGDGSNSPVRANLIRRSAATLSENRQEVALVALAWQCRQLGDHAMADEVFALAEAKLPDLEHPSSVLPAIAYLWRTEQYYRADKLLQPLLADQKLAADPSLWRLAAAAAEMRGAQADVVARLEKALDFEYQRLPEKVNLQAIQNDYSILLAQYQKLADLMRPLDEAPSLDFLARVVHAADRWRSLDPDPTPACQAAATIFESLRVKELAWEYLTTSVALHPGESAPWLSLAQTLNDRGQDALADRAFMSAFEAEPTNPQILWARAAHLRNMGKIDEAHDLLRQIADGKWQPRFNQLQEQALREMR